MTKNDLYRITRSFVGHFATNPALREKLNAVMTSDDLDGVADLINSVVDPKDNVTIDDIGQIRELAATMLPQQREPGGGVHIVNVVGGGGAPPPWP